MKKALMYAHVASMIELFNMPNIKLLQKLGYQVDVACNFEFGSTISDEKIMNLKKILNTIGVKYYQIDVPRKVSNVYNIKIAYKETKKLINKNGYDLIHCHSPIGGIICRLANKNSKNYKNCKMIYTAHGFHFFKGNSIIKNMIFRTIEEYAARYTDTLITINKEDYVAVKKLRLKPNGYVEYIPGVGIDLNKINLIHGNRKKLLTDLNLSDKATLLVSVGELNENKNHETVVRALPYLPDNMHYLVCGQGNMQEKLQQFAKELGVDTRLHLLGYQDNVIEILKSCDIFVLPSKREGLSVALMEAMACGLPCVVSSIRGNSDLIKNDINGYLVTEKKEYIEAIIKIYDNNNEMIGDQTILESVSINNINLKMKNIYLLYGK